MSNKRAASPASDSNQSSIKRSKVNGDVTNHGRASSPPKQSKAVRIARRLEWDDIPNWTHNHSPFLSLPVELLDKICGKEGGLQLEDHLALSGTCRMIRSAYTPAVWTSILARRAQTSHSFSEPLYITRTWKDMKDDGSADRIFSTAWEIANGIREVPSSPKSNSWRTTLQDSMDKQIPYQHAKRLFKVTDAELATLKHVDRRVFEPVTKLYNYAAVRSLALRSHGGPLNHMRLIRQSRAIQVSKQDSASSSNRTRQRHKLTKEERRRNTNTKATTAASLKQKTFESFQEAMDMYSFRHEDEFGGGLGDEEGSKNSIMAGVVTLLGF
ncbi:hypothetical protein FRC03_004713 [Tulasnella sp. 419]|nr:hypothetical protein FRC02_011316 [Tulasnella sp. 418]KAG8969039.1 hypothetical protein FRC03_004713 [Tulasnella sp. 419]